MNTNEFNVVEANPDDIGKAYARCALMFNVAHAMYMAGAFPIDQGVDIDAIANEAYSLLNQLVSATGSLSPTDKALLEGLLLAAFRAVRKEAQP